MNHYAVAKASVFDGSVKIAFCKAASREEAICESGLFSAYGLDTTMTYEEMEETICGADDMVCVEEVR